MRQIKFSTQFPSYHPSKGKPTDFVNALLASLNKPPLMQMGESFIVIHKGNTDDEIMPENTNQMKLF